MPRRRRRWGGGRRAGRRAGLCARWRRCRAISPLRHHGTDAFRHLRIEVFDSQAERLAVDQTARAVLQSVGLW